MLITVGLSKDEVAVLRPCEAKFVSFSHETWMKGLKLKHTPDYCIVSVRPHYPPADQRATFWSEVQKRISSTNVK